MIERHPTPPRRYELEDRRDMAKNEYDEPGIAIGCVIPDVGFVSIASVVFGCEEAKEIGGQMEIAQRIVDALNQAPPSETRLIVWHPVSETPATENAMFIVRDADGQLAFAHRYEGQWEHTADVDCGPIAQWFQLPEAPKPLRALDMPIGQAPNYGSDA